MSGALTTPDGGDSPVRIQASPNSKPSMSAGSSFSFDISSQKSESSSPSSGEQSPIRGRTLTRAPATNRESSGTRVSTNLEASARRFSFGNTLAYQRLLSRDLTAEPEDIFKTVVEPLPVGVERFRSSLSEELYRAATWENLDESIDLTRFGDHRDTFAILGLRHLQSRRVELPAEFWQGLLQYIDYDTYLSVRLSCRCWSIAISDAYPLHMPSTASHLPLEVLQNIYESLDPVDFNAARHTCRVWMKHSLGVRPLDSTLKRGGWGGAALADKELRERKCRILPDNVDLAYLLSKRLAMECSLRPDWTGNGLFKSPGARSEGDYCPTVGLVHTSQTDFSELSNGYAPNSDAESGAGLQFTVSVCNKFLLVTKGCIIYIYSLRANWLHTHQPGGHLSPMTTIICPHRVLSVSMDTSSNRFAVAALLEGRVGIVYDLYQGSSPTENPLSPAPQILPTFTNASYIPIENGPRSIYRNLCTSTRPPLSVAICPQRRCVAFGCSGGIELHWVDALTGQDLSRWFTLTAPSDSLYFLPSRPGMDSGKKLRLISSAYHPELKGDQGSKFYTGGGEKMNLEEILEGESERENDYRYNVGCDHYHAVPINDGRHILFTDPEEGDLCLGYDGPPGIGASKLVRRYILVGPKDAWGQTIVPRAYKSGTELRWGTRIVVGYGDRLWLFVIPPDRFAEEPQQTQSEREHQRARDEPYPLTPIRVDGMEFGRVRDLVEIAVDSTGGDLTVWAFAVNGMAYVWQLGGGPKAITRRIILNDGTVAPEKDSDGDTFMHGTSRPSSRAVQFDGSAPPAIPSDFDERDRIIDYDNDVSMPPIASSEDEGYESEAEKYEQEGGALAMHAPQLLGSWSKKNADWIPDYLRASGENAEDEDWGVDVLQLGRCEIVILSTHVQIDGIGFGRWTNYMAAIAR